jgi:outer membrane protein assembly factor BamB
VANGVVYVGSVDAKLYAFDAAGVTGCAGTPKTCAPLWTATTGSAIGFSSPAVANGVVYIGSTDTKLYAFDAAGMTSCAGTPKTCAPLWTATTGSSILSSPAVANGVVYIGSNDNKLYAYHLP